MLVVVEPLVGVGALVIMALFAPCFLGFTRVNDSMWFRLNNRLEKEVGFVWIAKEYTLTRHYVMMTKFRIRLSDREAWGYLTIGIASALLFATALVLLA